MTDMEIPGDHTEALPKRRFGLFRLGGSMAVAAEATASHEWLEEEPALFGLEQQLGEYQKLQIAHLSVVKDFVDDEENAQIFAASIVEHRGMPADRNARRSLQRTKQNDFEPLVAVFVTAGRIRASFVSDVVSKSDLSVRDVVRGNQSTRPLWQRADAKRASLFVPLQPTPSTKELMGRLETLEKNSRNTYKPIVKHEEKMDRFLASQIKDDPEAAADLLDSFMEYAESDAGLEKDFASFLANGYFVYGEQSLLEAALQTVEGGADAGTFVERYLEREITEDEGDTLLGFFAKRFDELGLDQTLTEFMLEHKEGWPSDLTAGYEAFTNKLTSDYRIRVQKAAERAVNRLWLHPDLVSYEDAIDRVFLKLHGLRIDQYARHLAKDKAKGPRPRLTVSPSEFLALENQEVDKSLEPAQLQRTTKGFTVNPRPLDDMLSEMLGRKSDPTIKGELELIINKLFGEPLGIGIQSLKDVRIDIDSKRRKVYSAKPAKIPGLSVSARTKEARILFALSNGHLAILGITSNHNEYERLIKNLHSTGTNR